MDFIPDVLKTPDVLQYAGLLWSQVSTGDEMVIKIGYSPPVIGITRGLYPAIFQKRLINQYLLLGVYLVWSSLCEISPSGLIRKSL